MLKTGRVRWLPLAAALCWALNGPPARAAEEAGPLATFVGIPPQAYVVERIGGKHVAAQVLVKPGQDPHTFEPSPRQMMALGRARIYFEVGMPFEKQLLAKIRQARPDLVVVDTSRGIKKRMMVGHHHDEADEQDHAQGEVSAAAPSQREGPAHADEAGHREEGEAEREEEADPHVWLSPPLLKVQAQNVAAALIAADAANAPDYRRNLDAFLKDVDATDERVRNVLAPYKGQSFYVFHPAFGYFGDAYGLTQEAVEVEGKSPSPRQLAELIRKARADGVHIIFVQPQFASASASAVAAAIDGAVVPMDPLAKDVLKNLDDMAVKIQAALKGRPQP
jgi:zinc transport system substrate-binding protein